MLEKTIAFAVAALVLLAGACGGAGTGEQNPSIDVLRPESDPVSVPLADSSIPEGYTYWKTVRARVTAYEPSWRCCGRFADGKTSIGDNAWRQDGVAADPSVIPYGTLVSIPKVGGLRKVDDTGPGMRKSTSKGIYHIDLRMKYYYQARQWGNQYLDVKLYRKQV